MRGFACSIMHLTGCGLSVIEMKDDGCVMPLKQQVGLEKTRASNLV